MTDHSDSDIYRPVQFEIADHFVNEFAAKLVGNYDCVVNALDVLRLVTPPVCDLLRQQVGHRGVGIDGIVCVFDSLTDERGLNRSHKFAEYAFTDFVKTINSLSPNHVMFVGIARPTGMGHVFLIAHSGATSRFVILDPQQHPKDIEGITRFRLADRGYPIIDDAEDYIRREYAATGGISGFFILEQKTNAEEREKEYMRVFNFNFNFNNYGFHSLMDRIMADRGYRTKERLYFAENPHEMYREYILNVSSNLMDTGGDVSLEDLKNKFRKVFRIDPHDRKVVRDFTVLIKRIQADRGYTNEYKFYSSEDPEKLYKLYIAS